MLTALLKLLQAVYLCPSTPVFLSDPHPHHCAYAGALQLISTGRLQVAGMPTAAARNGARQLASALDLHFQPYRLPTALDCRSVLGMQLYVRAASVLAQEAAQPQLSQAFASLLSGQPAGQPPFTLQQAQYVFHNWAVIAAIRVLRQAYPATDSPPSQQTAQQRPPGAAEAASALPSAAQAMMALEPQNLGTFHLAAMVAPGVGPVLPQHAGLRHLLQGVRLAQAQRSEYWLVQLAGTTLIECAADISAAKLDEVEAAAAAFQLAEAALARCKRLLPQPWVSSLQRGMATYRNVLPAVNAQLAGLHAEQSADQSAVASAAHRFDTMLTSACDWISEQATQTDASLDCAGCGRTAVGLRACARCRAVRYCSRECQAAHWLQHRRQCRPA